MHADEEATVWIGYADFLTTLAVLFFVIAVSFAAQLNTDPRPGYVAGFVVDADTRSALVECSVELGDEQRQETDASGRFILTMPDLVVSVRNSILVECSGYNLYVEVLALTPGDTTQMQVALVQDTSIVFEVLRGDALFERGQAELRKEAVQLIIAIGDSLRDDLRHGDLIAVQGHTDDTPFPRGVGKDNWILSGERASAAARVLIAEPPNGAGISECQVVVMGFSSSWPVHAILEEDDAQSIEEKRAENRRIEFRLLRGADITSGHCAD